MDVDKKDLKGEAPKQKGCVRLVRIGEWNKKLEWSG
jgi:hypothetical protein